MRILVEKDRARRVPAASLMKLPGEGAGTAFDMLLDDAVDLGNRLRIEQVNRIGDQPEPLYVVTEQLVRAAYRIMPKGLVDSADLIAALSLQRAREDRLECRGLGNLTHAVRAGRRPAAFGGFASRDHKIIEHTLQPAQRAMFARAFRRRRWRQGSFSRVTGRAVWTVPVCQTNVATRLYRNDAAPHRPNRRAAMLFSVVSSGPTPRVQSTGGTMADSNCGQATDKYRREVAEYRAACRS
jgi:hypothetical protein